MSFKSRRQLKKELKQLGKAEVREIKESEKAQRKGDLRTAIVHKDRAVDLELERRKTQRQLDQQFKPITQIRSSNF